MQDLEGNVPDQTLVAELARMAQLVAVSDAHRRELAELRDAVDRIGLAIGSADRGAVPTDVTDRLDGLQAAIDGPASRQAAAPDTGSGPADQSLVDELARMAQLVAVSDAHRRELAELREAVDRIGQAVEASSRGNAQPDSSAQFDALASRIEELASSLSGGIAATPATTDDARVSELARMAQLVAISDDHRRHLADLNEAVGRLALDRETPQSPAISSDLAARLDALQDAIDGLAPSLAGQIAGLAPDGSGLVDEFAQLARLVAVGDDHRRELAGLRVAVEQMARSQDAVAHDAPVGGSVPPDLSARLDALHGAIEAVARSRAPAPQPDPSAEVTRLSAEMAEMAKLVALAQTDRQRIAELHRMAGERSTADVTRQIDAIQRDIRRLVGAEPDLANPAWQRDRVARRRAEAELDRVQQEVLLLTDRVAALQTDLDLTRQSRRKLKKALKQHEHQARRQQVKKATSQAATPPAQRGTGVRSWVRTADAARPVRWLYRRLRPTR